MFVSDHALSAAGRTVVAAAAGDGETSVEAADGTVAAGVLTALDVTADVLPAAEGALFSAGYFQPPEAPPTLTGAAAVSASATTRQDRWRRWTAAVALGGPGAGGLPATTDMLASAGCGGVGGGIGGGVVSLGGRVRAPTRRPRDDGRGRCCATGAEASVLCWGPTACPSWLARCRMWASLMGLGVSEVALRVLWAVRVLCLAAGGFSALSCPPRAPTPTPPSWRPAAAAG